MKELAPGSLFAGKYRLIRPLGRGGMGQVYLARVEGLAGFEKQVALKIAHPHLADDVAPMELFLAEARLSAQLTHANIAQIFDLGHSEGTYFIAMEYVAGRDLRSLMSEAEKRGEMLPIALCCHAVLKLCEALEYAHRRKDRSGTPLKLVHRDVSPVNCLVSFTGEVKLIDFGIAKAATEASKTQPGIIRGKLSYLSPEQVKGMQLDRRSDLFSLGIIFYELLCGPRPFDGVTELETMQNIVVGKLKAPREMNPDLPEALEQILFKALAADRDQRYQWAREMEADLQRFLFSAAEPVGARELGDYLVELVGGTQVGAAELAAAGRQPTAATSALPNREGQTAASATGSRTTTPKPPPSPAEPEADAATMGATLDEDPPATLDVETRPRRKTWLATAIAAVLVVVAAACLALLRGPERPVASLRAPDASPANAAPDSAASAAFAPARPAPSAPPSDPAVGHPDAAVARVELDTIPKAPKTRVAKPPPPRKPVATSSKKPASARPFAGPAAFLTVRANRPAEVFVDGKSIGNAPKARYPLSPGRHELRVDCLYVWGRHPGPIRAFELLSDAEADVLHECVETKAKPRLAPAAPRLGLRR